MDQGARVIHELDEAGNVVRIGWEPASCAVDRRRAIAAVTRLMNCVGCALVLMQSHGGEPLIGAILQSREMLDLAESLADVRGLMPAMHRSDGQGMRMPSWEAAPESKRYRGRAA
jgi:hypothetical protein